MAKFSGEIKIWILIAAFALVLPDIRLTLVIAIFALALALLTGIKSLAAEKPEPDDAIENEAERALAEARRLLAAGGSAVLNADIMLLYMRCADAQVLLNEYRKVKMNLGHETEYLKRRCARFTGGK